MGSNAAVKPTGGDIGTITLKMKNLPRAKNLKCVTQNDLNRINKETSLRVRNDTIRQMILPMSVKKILRSKYRLSGLVRSLGGWRGFVYKRKVGYQKFRRKWSDLGVKVEIWRKHMRKIEGHYGSAVASYFVFLKWLLFLNLYIFLLTTTFIVVPQLIFDAEGYTFLSNGNNSDEKITLSQECSEAYKDYVSTNYTTNVFIDFLQGTGWLERTSFFEGYYSDQSLYIGYYKRERHLYNMPLAYLLVVVVSLILSLVLMVEHTGHGLKTSLADSEIFQYVNLVYCGWDFSQFDPYNVKFKHILLKNEIESVLEEDRHEREKQGRSFASLCCLYLARVSINIFVVAALLVCGYIIYVVTDWSTKETQRDDFVDEHIAFRLLIEYIPSVTITALNILIPLVFRKIVILEDYKPSFVLQITLARTVFLRLASLGVIIATLYRQINCSSIKDECSVSINQQLCPVIPCWETYVGQQIYKLTILDIIVVVAVIFLIETPRAAMRKCDCKLGEKIGNMEFIVPKHVLDLVYSQTLCWLGMFFSPVIPIISVIKFLIFFYIKKLTVMSNYVPSSRPYRASKSHFFFMLILLIAFLLCCIPLGYVVWRMPPSKGCGPFRIHDHMYDIMSITINNWPPVIQDIFDFLFSAGFAVPFFVILIIMLYYYHSATLANRARVRLLREQLIAEIQDRQIENDRTKREGKKKIEVRDRRIFMAEGEDYVHDYEIDEHGVPQQIAKKPRRLQAPKAPVVYPSPSERKSDIESQNREVTQTYSLTGRKSGNTRVTVHDERTNGTAFGSNQKYSMVSRQHSKEQIYRESVKQNKSGNFTGLVLVPAGHNIRQSTDQQQEGNGNIHVAQVYDQDENNEEDQIASPTNGSHGSQQGLVFATLPNQTQTQEIISVEKQTKTPENQVFNSQPQKGSQSKGSSRESSQYNLVFATLPERAETSDKLSTGKESRTSQDQARQAQASKRSQTPVSRQNSQHGLVFATLPGRTDTSDSLSVGKQSRASQDQARQTHPVEGSKTPVSRPNSQHSLMFVTLPDQHRESSDIESPARNSPHFVAQSNQGSNSSVGRQSRESTGHVKPAVKKMQGSLDNTAQNDDAVQQNSVFRSRRKPNALTASSEVNDGDKFV